VPTPAQVRAQLRASGSYERVGEELGIRPGLAYMIATGLPADGSDVLSQDELESRPGLLEGSTQHLVNPPTDNPKHQQVVEEWMKGRVAADAAMRRAGEARTATPPPVEAEDETDDLVSVIGWQHNQVQYLEQQLEAIPGVKKGGSEAKQQQRVSIVDMIRVQLSKHETAEGEHFWPAVRQHLQDGDQLADQGLAQEQEGKDLLQEMMGVPGSEERFDDLVEKLVEALRKHVALEDTVLLRFAAEVGEEKRNELGAKFKKSLGHAPTRPHPHAPSEGAALKAGAALAGPMDRARDALGDRPAEREGRPEVTPANEVTRKLEKQKKGTKRGAE
jgi:hemerythrin-like domain-containing protein